jgi:hypothetical protein
MDILDRQHGCPGNVPLASQASRVRGSDGWMDGEFAGSVAGINTHAIELGAVDKLPKNLGFNVVGYF